MAADNLQLMSKADSSDEIPPPADKKDINRFLADVQSNPDYREVERRLESLGETCERGDVRYWSIYQHSSNGKWTASRARLHRTLVEKALAGRQKTPEGTKPIAVLLIGTPGSGKTSEGMKYTEDFAVDFVVINADDVKENLPEYRGWNAAALHEESSYVAEELIYEKAVAGRHHIIFDLTGTDHRATAFSAPE
jgi:Zeta toxin